MLLREIVVCAAVTYGTLRLFPVRDFVFS